MFLDFFFIFFWKTDEKDNFHKVSAPFIFLSLFNKTRKNKMVQNSKKSIFLSLILKAFIFEIPFEKLKKNVYIEKQVRSVYHSAISPFAFFWRIIAFFFKIVIFFIWSFCFFFFLFQKFWTFAGLNSSSILLQIFLLEMPRFLGHVQKKKLCLRYRTPDECSKNK